MSTDSSTVTSSTLTVSDLTVQVIRKPIKNLHLAVYPPDGRVRVAAPEHFDDDAIRLAVVDRLAWIHQQRQELQDQPRQSEREMVNGESHYVWGRRYRLRINRDASASGDVELLSGDILRLSVRPDADRDDRHKALTEWYRSELKDAVGPLVEQWADQLGIEVKEWRIRRMRTKWGSCNQEAGRVWFNLELAKKPPQSLEYVVVHELLHLQEQSHNDHFKGLMTQALPDWQQRRDVLYRLPLSDEEWPPATPPPLEAGA